MSASIWTPGTQVAQIIDPEVPINILPGTAAVPGLDFQGDTNTGLFQSAPGYINFTINGVDAMEIDPLGNVTTKLGKWISNEEVDVATAATVDLGGSTSNVVRLTGTTNVGSFGTTYKGPIFCRAASSFVLSNTASLVLPNSTSITVAAGDSWIAAPKATAGTSDGWIVYGYNRATGNPINVNSDLSNTLRTDVASTGTIDLTTPALEFVRNLRVTGTTAITGFTVAAGGLYFVSFSGITTLTNNAAIVTQTGGNITTASGDTCVLRATAANTVEVLCYVKGVQPSPIPNVVVITATGTWTAPANVTRAKVTVVGGGGGSSVDTSNNRTGGGAGGGTAIKWLTVIPGTVYTATIGAGGAGSATDPGAGSAGGTSSFSGSGITTLTATGGPGNGGSSTNGGTGTNGDINITGGASKIGPGAGANYGTGGATPFAMPAGYGQAGTGYGGGGGSTIIAGTTGNAGAAGVVIVEY